MNETAQINQIKNYIHKCRLKGELGKLYIKAAQARNNYYGTSDYYFTDDDMDTFIMLASAWSAILRRAWRIFVVELEYEPFTFWNACVLLFVFEQNVLFQDWWAKEIKINKKLKTRIEKTSNPKFIKGIFTGMNWKQMHDELNKSR